MSDSDTNTGKHEPEADTWGWLTIMVGPEVSGKEQIRFGRVIEPWEQLTDDGDLRFCAEPVQYIPLPKPMTRPEVEDWLEHDDWGEKYLELFAEDNTPSSSGSSEGDSSEAIPYECPEGCCASDFTLGELETHLESTHNYSTTGAKERVWESVGP